MAMSPRLLRPRATSAYDADAQVYFNAVAIADGQQLEPAVKKAISDFVKGCKADGIWTAIKASCILMGARTLSGALTPLVGAAPTNNGPFVSGDYNRKTGLVGNGSTKYLDSNRNNNADAQNSHHQSIYVAVAPTTGAARAYIGAGAAATGSTQITLNGVLPFSVEFRNRNTTVATPGATGSTTGLIGQSRSTSASYVARAGGTSSTQTVTSETPHNGNALIFARNSGTNTAGLFNNGSFAFYSIGESLDLALLDSRVSALYTAIGAAIP